MTETVAKERPQDEQVFVHCRKMVERCACVPMPISRYPMFGDFICVFRKLDPAEARRLASI